MQVDPPVEIENNVPSASDVEVVESEEDSNPSKKSKIVVPKNRGTLIVKPFTTAKCWDHFKIYSLDQDWAVCTICKHESKYRSKSGSNTSHLNDHLKTAHRHVIKSELEDKAKVSLNVELKAVTETITEIRNHKKTLTHFGVCAPRFEKCLTRYCDNSLSRSLFEYCFRWVCEKYIPLCTVEDQYFRDMCSSLNPNVAHIGKNIKYFNFSFIFSNTRQTQITRFTND